MRVLNRFVVLALFVSLSLCMQLTKHLPAYTAGGSTLKSGDYLPRGAALSSGTGLTFGLQVDGNIVLKRTNATTNTSRQLWASNTAGKGGVKLELQADGNLVLRTQNNLPVWSSLALGATARGPGPYKVVMQKDGNVVVWNANGAVIWHTNTRI